MKKNIIIAILSMLALLQVGMLIMLSNRFENELDNKTVKSDTVQLTDTVYSTFFLSSIPTRTKETVLRTDTLRLTHKEDTVVPIDITQKTYSFSSDTLSYTAYVSGYQPQLDSIRAKINYPTIINAKTVTNTIYKRKHFNISPSIGIGYGVVHKQPDVYVGVTIGYNIW